MGSPPQVRGKPDIFVILILLLGITPAGAGKTDTGISLFGGNRDHPRRCGENAARLSIRCWFAGSPPQVRGKPNLDIRIPREPGITPAGAGKTEGEYLVRLLKEDHPRRCGENIKIFQNLCKRPGSPPQVRGKQGCHTVKILSGGITPAGAGKTGHAHGVRHRHTDHPRRCGENAVKAANTGTHVGSPPQVRGKLIENYCLRLYHRITPAGAGKTTVTALKAERERDHPRRCGENMFTARNTCVPVGSPPQVRGKLSRFSCFSTFVRITPAGAGKTY